MPATARTAGQSTLVARPQVAARGPRFVARLTTAVLAVALVAV